MAIDWKKITGNKNITEVSHIVETFYVTPKRNTGLSIKIEVHEYPETEFKYLALASHAFWCPGNPGNPYISNNRKDSIEDAINESIKGFCPFDIDKYPDDVIFYVTEDIHRIGKYLDYIDGTGHSVTKEEAKEKINQWKKKNAPDIA